MGLVLLPFGEQEERALLAQLRQGQPQAFEALYHRFVARVLRLATSMLGAQQAAEDATQETFLRVYRGVHRFRGEAGLGTWIHRIAINVCKDELARSKRRPLPVESLTGVAPETRPVSPQPPERLDLLSLLAALEPLKRATFVLHHVEGMSAAEVAEVLGESREAVLKRLQRTRRELALRLDEELGKTNARGAVG
jgi:RNA polymerase sigma-70 factor (ECF subfamily)